MQVFKVYNDKDLEKFLDFIKNHVKLIPRKGIIGIDGARQSGKSKIITTSLVNLLRAKLIDLDKLININEKEILYSDEFPPIKKGDWYIADGVLNRKILEHYRFISTVDVYVKKIANYGWTERDWLDKQHIKEYGLNKDFMNNNVDREIYYYHNSFSPEINADIYVEISEGYVTKDFYLT